MRATSKLACQKTRPRIFPNLIWGLYLRRSSKVDRWNGNKVKGWQTGFSRGGLGPQRCRDLFEPLVWCCGWGGALKTLPCPSYRQAVYYVSHLWCKIGISCCFFGVVIFQSCFVYRDHKPADQTTTSYDQGRFLCWVDHRSALHVVFGRWVEWFKNNGCECYQKKTTHCR